MRPLLVSLLAAATLAQPAKIFVFEQPFWINLHHFLYVLGRAENRAPDRSRRAVANAPKDQDAGLARLTTDEQSTWHAVVTEYAKGWSKKDIVFDSESIAFTARLLKPAAPDDEALRRAEPIYRKAWWPEHARSNDARIKELEQLVSRHGAAVLAYITRAYQQPWPAGGYPVNVSGYTNWAGAYSTDNRFLVVSSLDPEQHGLSGLEIIFHEAMHQWDEAVDTRLKAAATRAGRTAVPDGLSHAMIFYTAGQAVHSIAADYVPYADANGVWDRGMSTIKPVLDKYWKPYLDPPSPRLRRTGADFDAALDAILREIQ